MPEPNPLGFSGSVALSIRDLGGDAADRVSAGQVQRGAVSRIAAAILFADVRGSKLPAEQARPNKYRRARN